MRADPSQSVVEPRKPSTFNIEVPGPSETGPGDYTAVALTAVSIHGVLVGAASPSVTGTVRFGPDRTPGGGTEIIVGGFTVTSTTTGHLFTVLNNPLIPGASKIWFESTAKSGTVDSIEVSVVYA